MNQKSDYTITYQTLHGTEPPPSVTWETSAANILSAGRGFMGGFDYTMQVQVGCPGACLPCYVIAGGLLAPAEVRGHNGQSWGFVVRNKAEVIAKLKHHLQSGVLADKTLYWSGVTDPYAAPCVDASHLASLHGDPARAAPPPDCGADPLTARSRRGAAGAVQCNDAAGRRRAGSRSQLQHRHRPQRPDRGL